jgi:ribonuclease PH
MPRRPQNELRPLSITPHYLAHPEGSVLVGFGDTLVICTASINERVPRWMSGKGTGWVSAEYDMLPRATHSRRDRDARKGKLNGRSQEISRLIGRSLRAICDMQKLGERAVTIDCDVIQADGGTRTAAITGGYAALAIACRALEEKNLLKENPLTQAVAAISVGIVEGEVMLDLDYALDSQAQVDMNVVMTADGELAEIQGTAEARTFSRDQLTQMLDLSFEALPRLLELQQKAIDAPFTRSPSIIHL